MMSPETLARFEAKVDRSGGPDACHLWTGATTGFGYGKQSVRGRLVGAHVLALEEKLGRSLLPGFEALHSCPGGDNPACCNPEHLREGTHAENMADRDERGRARAPGARGERNGRAVMTEVLVLELRAEQAGGGTIRGIARRRGLDRGTVRLALRGETWKQPEGPRGPSAA